MRQPHDSNYYRRQRVILNWALRVFFMVVFVVMALYNVVQISNAYKESLPMYLPWRVFPLLAIVFTGFIILLKYRDLINKLEEVDESIEVDKNIKSTTYLIDTRPLTELIEKSQSVESEISKHPELKQACNDGIITSGGKLKVYRSDFVRYCVANKFFFPQNIQKSWMPIDSLLTSASGKTITADMLRQSYQDLAQQGKVD